MYYIAKRLAFYVLAAFVAITVNFFLPRLTPGDPASTIVATYSTSLNAESLAALKAAYGLTDEPLLQQYLTYLGNVLRGDFGRSLSNFPAPVMAVIGAGFGWSILLGLTSVLLSFVLGSVLGAIAAWRRYCCFWARSRISSWRCCCSTSSASSSAGSRWAMPIRASTRRR
jgi:peptide/nickel transport system permease protein